MQSLAIAKQHHILRLSSSHLEETCVLLKKAFPGGLLSHVGENFLRAFVRSFVDQDDSSSFVSLADGRVTGFLLGSLAAAQHRRHLVRRCWPPIIRDLPRTVIRSPGLARWVLGRGLTWAVRHRANSTQAPANVLPEASLILMTVASDYRGHGAARDLVATFLDDLAWRGVPAVKLAVDADNIPALNLYRSLGWVIASRHRSPGQVMTFRMVRDLAHPIAAAHPLDDAAPEFIPPTTPDDHYHR